jgi:hypothetical protein
MIKSLTKEQTDALPQFRDEWIRHGRSTAPFNEANAKLAVAKWYECAKREQPKEIVFIKSPKAAVEYLKNRFKGLTNNDITSSTFYGQFEVGWISFYVTMRDLLKVSGVDAISGYEMLAKEAGVCFMFDTIAVITHKPTVLHINEANRLHCTNGPAIAWADGNCVYSLNGITMPSWLFETPKDQITGKQIMGIANAEIRGEAIKWYGLNNMLDLLDATVIDTGTEHGYQLLSLDVGTGRKEMYLKMNNPSTGEIHIEGVPPETKTVMEALSARWSDKLRLKYGFKNAIARA